MNGNHGAQSATQFRSAQNTHHKPQASKSEYRKNANNYTDSQQELREQAHTRHLTAPPPPTFHASDEFAVAADASALVEALLNAVPTLGLVALQIVLCVMKGDKTAIMLALIILSQGMAPQGAAAADPAISEDNSVARATERMACGRTNFLPANKNEGTMLVSDVDTASNVYRFYEKKPSGMSKAQWTNLNEQRQQRTKTFNHLNLRKKSYDAHRITADKMMADCRVTSATISKSPINRNVVESIIVSKSMHYQYIKEMYSSRQRPLIGNCYEMNAQAALLVLPKLKPDQEFFVQISGLNRKTNNDHVYGLIIPRNLLMGEGLSPEKRSDFRKLISNPFFREGKGVIQLKGNEKLFWEGLGISNTKATVVNQDIAGQTRFCDPYMGTGLYYDGLDQCFGNQQTAQTYLFGLETIMDIRILTWEIPRELKSKVSHSVECLNDEINRKISLLVEKRIEPALVGNVAGMPIANKQQEL